MSLPGKLSDFFLFCKIPETNKLLLRIIILRLSSKLDNSIKGFMLINIPVVEIASFEI